MVGVRRLSRQLMAPPAHEHAGAAPPAVSHYSYDGVRVPENSPVNTWIARPVRYVGGSADLRPAAHLGRIALNPARAYFFRLRLPRSTTADRTATTEFLLNWQPDADADLQSVVRQSVTSSGSDAHDRICALGPADFAGRALYLNYLTVRSSLSIVSRAGARWNEDMSFSPAPMTIMEWA